MRIRIYLEDLRDDALARIREATRWELADAIEDAVACGVEREVAEQEVVEDHLNRHNAGWEVEL